MRFSNFLRSQAALQTSAKPFRLSPGQVECLARETGNPRPTSFTSPLGVHPIVRIHCATRALGDNVILAPREDLFIESEDPEGVRLVSVGNSVTSVPDNIAAVEVISAGEFAPDVKPGDIVFIDFYRVKQGYIIENEELYIAGGDAFAAKFDPETQEVEPLDNFVTTKRDHDRMKLAINGSTELHIPDFRLTEGIVSGRTSKGGEAAHVVYEVIVAVGKLTKRPRPGVMTPAERKFLDIMVEAPSCLYHGDLDAETALRDIIRERANGRNPDVLPGDLVAFCKEIATQLRVRGDHRSLIPYENVLAAIDDADIRARAEARKQAAEDAKPRLVLV